MTPAHRLGGEWRSDDPDPPPGTILEKGGPKDKVSFMRGHNTWFYAHNQHQYRRCHDSLVRFWAPLKIVRAFSPDKKEKRR